MVGVDHLYEYSMYAMHIMITIGAVDEAIVFYF